MSKTYQKGDFSTCQIKVDMELIESFARVSGDFNRIHLDEAYAATTPFRRRLAHGMLLGALVSGRLSLMLGENVVAKSMSLEFVYPVFVGDTVAIDCEILSIDEETKDIRFSYTVKNLSHNRECLKGEAVAKKF